MTFRALLITYIFGGITFIPLLLAAILIPAWLLLPQVESGGKPEEKDKLDISDNETREALLAAHDEKYEPEGGTSGTFAVLRKYDFQAANAAFNARNNNSNAAGNAAGGDVDGTIEAGTGSQSVYQSMYRSVFDRGKNLAASGASVLQNKGDGEEDENAANGKAKKRGSATPANVFYIVLRHGHLMLYDSAAQIEVRHVISLAHHTVSLTEGLDNGEPLKDADLFIKRTAIVLNPTSLPNGKLQHAAVSKPFYLFSSTCIEKEDFYHALLYTRSNPPIPEPLNPNDAIKLQSTLHGTSLTSETRAFNALIGRIFLSLYNTDRAKEFITSRVEKKISRVQKPAFIASLAVESIDLGDAAPVLSNPRLKDLNISGDMTLAFDLKYTGGIKLTISAVAKLDLGTRFKTRTVSLVLASSLQRLSGHMLIRIKPPPSNRFWFCFETMPEMDIKVEPVVSQRQITYTFILRAIEERIRSVVGETLVKPNWDDVAFFDTRSQHVRGGIWRDEGDEAGADEKAGDTLRRKNDKTKSMPALPLASTPATGTDADSDANTSSSSETNAKKLALGSSTSATGNETPPLGHLKRRSVASLPATNPAHSSTEKLPATPPVKPIRSPSLTSPSASAPSVALDESLANIDLDAQRSQPAQQHKWRIRSVPQTTLRKEALEAMREVRDRSSFFSEKSADDEDSEHLETGGDGATYAEPEDDDAEHEHLEHDNSAALKNTPTMRSLRSPPNRSNTNMSTASSSTTKSQQQNRKTILAATAAATTAAKNWSWNAIASRTKSGGQGNVRGNGQQQQGQQTQPMGRGQPLPPPGVPLPGPQKGLFGSLTGGSVRRKPVPPPRRSMPAFNGEHSESTQGQASADHKGSSSISVSADEVGEDENDGAVGTPSDEFGPWRQNSGLEGDSGETAGHAISNDNVNANGLDGATVDTVSDHEAHDEVTKTPVQEKKVPPPLPRRPKADPVTSTAQVAIDSDPPNSSSPVADDKSTSHIQHEEDASAKTDHGYSYTTPAEDDKGDREPGDEIHVRSEMAPSSSNSTSVDDLTNDTDNIDATEGEATAKFEKGEAVGEDDFGPDDSKANTIDEQDRDVMKVAAPVEDEADQLRDGGKIQDAASSGGTRVEDPQDPGEQESKTEQSGNDNAVSRPRTTQSSWHRAGA